MRNKPLHYRIIIVVLCVVSVFCMACPAFAAIEPPYVDGAIYVGHMVMHEDDFTISGNKYVAFPIKPLSITPVNADICIVTYGTIVRCLKWWSYSGEAFDNAYCIGNPALLDASLSDNGEQFVFALSMVSPKNSYFACNPVFYLQHVIGTGEDGLSLYFSKPDDIVDASGFMSEAGKVFESGVNMVGDVVEAVTSNPILYLPILIGLSGLGIVFFKRLKQ